jgi:LCP family protein required for cell wall assembly
MIFAKLKRRVYKHLWLLRPIFFIFSGLALVFLLYLITPPVFSLAKKLIRGPAYLISFLNPKITHLDTYRERTNILLLGMGGGDHPGADLTDSMMLISINPETNDTVILSLPRDIWVESLQGKLNSAYHLGETKKPGAGLVLAKAAVSEILDQPVHYTVLLDFTGFEKAIDIVGGISIDVPRGFTDFQYPIPGKETAEPESARYQVVTFKAGRQIMDGDTALKYVRTRHAEGEEGTDFARAQRQQRVILAFKDKVLSVKILLNPIKLKRLFETFSESVITDLPVASYPELIKLVFRIDQDSIRTGILNEGSVSEDIPPLLYNPPLSLYGQWVLLPSNNDWQAVHEYVEEILYQNQ